MLLSHETSASCPHLGRASGSPSVSRKDGRGWIQLRAESEMVEAEGGQVSGRDWSREGLCPPRLFEY